MYKIIDGDVYKPLILDLMTIQEMVDFLSDDAVQTHVTPIITKILPNFQVLLNLYGDPKQAIAHLPEGKLREITKEVFATNNLPSESTEEFPV